MDLLAGGGGMISVKPQHTMKTISNAMVPAVTPADMILFFFSWSMILLILIPCGKFLIRNSSSYAGVAASPQFILTSIPYNL